MPQAQDPGVTKEQLEEGYHKVNKYLTNIFHCFRVFAPEKDSQGNRDLSFLKSTLQNLKAFVEQLEGNDAEALSSYFKASAKAKFQKYEIHEPNVLLYHFAFHEMQRKGKRVLTDLQALLLSSLLLSRANMNTLALDFDYYEEFIHLPDEGEHAAMHIFLEEAVERLERLGFYTMQCALQNIVDGNQNSYPITKDKRWAKIKYEMLAMTIVNELENPKKKH